MKKFSYFLAFIACLHLSHASKLTDLIATQTGQKTSVLEEQPLEQDPDLKLVILKDEASGFKVAVIANKSESLVIPITTLFTSNQKDRDSIISKLNTTSNYNMTFKTQAAVKAEINKLPKDSIIELKGKTSKKVFYIVSDPLCPHCQVELNNIEKRLQEGDVKMIPIGMMGEESAKRVADIHNLAKTLKTDSEKIAMLKKVYSRDYKPKATDIKAVQEITRSLLGKGKVEGTPYIIEEDQ